MKFEAGASTYEAEVLTYYTTVLGHHRCEKDVYRSYHPMCSAVPAPEKSIELSLPVHQG
jgi:hypothetical protein